MRVGSDSGFEWEKGRNLTNMGYCNHDYGRIIS